MARCPYQGKGTTSAPFLADQPWEISCAERPSGVNKQASRSLALCALRADKLSTLSCAARRFLARDDYPTSTRVILKTRLLL